MDFARWTYWQWACVGAVAGAAIGLSWVNMPTDFPRTVDPATFLNNVGKKGTRAVTNQLPRVDNLVVYDIETDPEGKALYPVTYDELGTNRAGDRAVYRKSGAYIPKMVNEQTDLIAYLNNAGVSFANRTGNHKWMPLAYGAGAGVVLIGLVWPTLIRMMVGLGIEKEKPEFKLSDYKPQKESAKPASKKGVTAKDLAALDALNASLEQSVGPIRTHVKADAKQPTEDVDPLQAYSNHAGTTDPTAQAPEDKPAENKEFAGEWYPVLKKKTDDKK